MPDGTTRSPPKANAFHCKHNSALAEAMPLTPGNAYPPTAAEERAISSRLVPFRLNILHSFRKYREKYLQRCSVVVNLHASTQMYVQQKSAQVFYCSLDFELCYLFFIESRFIKIVYKKLINTDWLYTHYTHSRRPNMMPGCCCRWYNLLRRSSTNSNHSNNKKQNSSSMRIAPKRVNCISVI